MLRPGDLLADRFRLESLVAEGGMAVVYRARDEQSGGAPVALKCLRQAVYGDRFLREARIIAEIDHPNVVRHLGHGRTDDGDWYLALEWLDGQTLRARLGGRPLALPLAVDLVRQAALALGAAHARGVVHRDVKPENFVLVRREPEAAPGSDTPQVKLIDFGIARFADGLTTRTGTSMGTPEYMAPEQARGDRALDARADVFSLGCVLYECLVGRSPFRADHAMAVLARILLDEVAPIRGARPEVPRALERLVLRMLARDPAERPADGAAVARALAEATGEAGRASVGRATGPTLAVRERRLVSVIVGAGPRGAGALVPGPVITMMTPPPDTDALARDHGGRVERFVDGSFLVILDGAAPHELARRAASCALALARREPRRALGLATGHAELGADAPPIGDVIDRAVTPLRAAPVGVGGVFIDETTARLLGDGWSVERGGAHPRLVGGAGPARPAAVAWGSASFVGRERELALLDGVAAECFAEPVARVVLVVGDPGAGKSRLRAEALTRLHAREPALRQWVVRAELPRAGEPYGMCAALLRQVIAVPPGTPPERQGAMLRDRVARVVAPERVDFVHAALGEMLGLPAPREARDASIAAASASPVVMGEHMRAAFAEWLAAELDAGPLVLALEDVHWTDAPSLACVSAALTRAPRRPLCVLATARPEVFERHPGLWAERELETVRLGPLSRSAAERLVRPLLPAGAPERTLARIVDCGEGNPLFLEELARWVAEGHDEDFPPTVLAMMEAQLARLDEPARRVLRAASVFGPSFHADGVAALLADRTRADVDLELDALARAHLVRRRGDAAPPGEPELEFTHALAQEAAYFTLTDEDRRLGHRLAGAWLAARGGTDHRMLGRHHELGGEPDKARAAYLRAARLALRSGDLDLVVDCVDRGLRSGARGGERGELLLMRAEALQWHGENAEAVPLAREALLLLPHGSPMWCRAAGLCAILHGTLRHVERLRAVADELALVPIDTASAELWTALGRTATYLVFAGELETSEALLGRLTPGDAELARDNPLALGWALTARSVVAWLRGDPGGALDISRQAATMFELAGDRLSAAYGRSNLGYFYSALGAHRAAELELRAALEAGRARGVDYVVASAAQNLGLALARLGELDEAVELERESVRLFALQGDVRMECGSRLYLVDMRLERGELGQAEEELRALLARDELPAADRVGALALLARALRLTGRTAEAVMAVVSARALAADVGPIEEHGLRVELEAAETFATAGERAEAAAALVRAVGIVRAQAALIADDALRATYEQNVPEVRRVLELTRDGV